MVGPGSRLLGVRGSVAAVVRSVLRPGIFPWGLRIWDSEEEITVGEARSAAGSNNSFRAKQLLLMKMRFVSGLK